MMFSAAEFNAHLKPFSQSVMWRRAYACACFSPASGHADRNCAVCNGNGQTWDDEKPSFFALQALSERKAMQQFGVYEEGDVLATIGSDTPAYEMGRYDRIRSEKSTHAFSEHMRRGYGDKLLGTVVSIDRTFWMASGNTSTIDGPPPTISCDGSLTWEAGEGPGEGVTYSISGRRYDEWYAFPALPQNRAMHDGAALPRKILLRRFDLFGRNEGR